MGESLQIGVFLTHADDLVGPDLDQLVDVAREIEAAGVDYLVVADHVVLGTNLASHAALGGPFPFPTDEPYPDPLVLLAAVAAVTTRVRLMTGILIAPLRPAVLLAKMAATLACLAQGRFDLGVGTGWQQEEFDALGVPMANRGRRLEDAVRACHELWGGGLATYRSETVAFEDVACSPTPPGGDVPVWFAGGTDQASLRRVATLGAGWLPLQAPSEAEMGQALADLTARCREAGRDPAAIGVRVPLPVTADEGGRPDLTAMAAEAARLAASGVTGVHVPLGALAPTRKELSRVIPDLPGLVR